MEDTSVDTYISYVNGIIRKYKKLRSVVNEAGEVSPLEVNSALAAYSEVFDGLIAEYQRTKAVHRNLDTQYTLWSDTAFQEAKVQVIAGYKELKSVKPSVKEFEVQMRVNHAEEWADWQTKLQDAEAKERFILRMLNHVSSFDKILTTLSSNMRAEMMTFTLDSRMAHDPERVTARRIRRPVGN